MKKQVHIEISISTAPTEGQTFEEMVACPDINISIRDLGKLTPKNLGEQKYFTFDTLEKEEIARGSTPSIMPHKNGFCWD